MSTRLRLAMYPIPEPERLDTSLRYTDILFGFVIRELFLRLQNWSQLDSVVRWHLIAGTILVLGSWIGYRRSLNRSGYQVKFFNLPIFRFLVDQMMLILYFRIAVLTNVDGTKPLDARPLSTNTIELVTYVFVLYVIWDLLGMWMVKAKTSAGADQKSKPKYPLLKDGKMTEEQQRADWVGLSISFVTLAIFVVVRLSINWFSPRFLLLVTTTLLLGYRWAKETRTSWRLLQPA